MPIPLYLAMTGAEFFRCSTLPPKIAWMACHFSPYGTGLSNLPPSLPEGSLLILNDRTPVNGHDPHRIAEEMAMLATQQKCSGILLDLQHPGLADTKKIVQSVCSAAPCPVAVTDPYCQEANCAVFLTPPLHIPLSEYLAAWQGREIWLEAAVEGADYLLTKEGCQVEIPGVEPADYPHQDAAAFCKYRIHPETDAARFSLRRDKAELYAMMGGVEGVSCFVGLYQQLK